LWARLGDPYVEARDEVVVALARRRDRSVIPFLAQLLTEPGVSALVVKAANHLADPALLPFLRRVEPTGVDVRAAIEACERQPGKPAQPTGSPDAVRQVPGSDTPMQWSPRHAGTARPDGRSLHQSLREAPLARSARMPDVDAIRLHWAARRYLVERYDELTRRYAELPNGGRADDGYHYTPAAKEIFPRYNVVQAMLDEVERFDPDRLPGMEPLGADFVRAAEVAQSPFTQPPQDDIEAGAVADERQLFHSKVLAWMTDPALQAAPLGYRRVLTPEESSDWRTRLTQRWGVQDDSWHPMLAEPVPEDVLVLTEDSMWDGPGVDLVRQALAAKGGRRVAQLREYGGDHLLDVQLVAPRYTGAEGLWSDHTLDWIAFASHEGTVAFGGTLVGALRATWRDLDNWRWQGW
jgi:hypothetical protein